jgi:3-oxoacyl-[acyl-carrier-protein] synthase-3
MQLRDTYLRSLGVCLPPDLVSGAEATTLGWYGMQFPDYDVTGVSVAERITALDMAVQAAREALRRSGQAAGQVGLLLHAAHFWQGPEGWSAPGYLLRELGCGEIAAHEVHQGCNGMLALLELAAGQLVLAPDTVALLTATQNANSPVLDRWRSAGPGIVLGDGACAVVLGTQRGFAEVRSVVSRNVSELEAFHRGAASLREPRDAIRPPINVLGRMMEFVATTRYQLPEVMELVVAGYSTVMAQALAETGIEAEQLARVLFSHVSPSMTQRSVLTPLGLPASRTAWDFGRTVGHLGPADQIVALDHLVRTGELTPGDHVLMVGGSAGYNVAGAVLTIVDCPVWT